MNKHLVAVYGSLKKGFGNNVLLSDSKFISSGTTYFKLYDMISFGAFPGVVTGEETIEVEVYEVDDDTLERLDALESHPRFYKRNLTTIDTSDGLLAAWMYTLCHNCEQYQKNPKVTTMNKGALTWQRQKPEEELEWQR